MQRAANVAIIRIAGFLDVMSLSRLGRVSVLLERQLSSPTALGAWRAAARGCGESIASCLASEESPARIARMLQVCPEVCSRPHNRSQVLAAVRACLRGDLATAQLLADAFGLVSGDGRAGGRYNLTAGELESFGLPAADEHWLAIAFVPGQHPPPDLFALDLVCRSGNVSAAQWLVARFDLDQQALSASGCAAMSEACARGDLAVARWLVDRFKGGDGFDNLFNREFNPLGGACDGRHYELAEWLIREFKLSAEDLFESGSLGCACLDGDRDKIDSLVALFGLSPAQLLGEGIDTLADCCSAGALAAMQRAAGVLGLDERAVRDHDAGAPGALLVRACKKGHLAVAGWLADTFGLTAEDVRAGGNPALRAACAGGEVGAAAWLVARFDIAADVRDGRDAMREACAYGHMKTAEWAVATFGPACLGGPAEQAETLVALCAHPSPTHLCGANWFASKSGISPETVRAENYRVLRDVGRAESSAALRWLITMFSLDRADCAAAGVRLPYGAWD